MKQDGRTLKLNGEASHPTRVRGLKLPVRRHHHQWPASHPTRVRGLKLPGQPTPAWIPAVAPHAGAWIETRYRPAASGLSLPSHPTRVRGLKLWTGLSLSSGKRSHPTRVRGLKPMIAALAGLAPLVAPHAGAWIETAGCCRPAPAPAVAPHASAWIETTIQPLARSLPQCRTPRGCVD